MSVPETPRKAIPKRLRFEVMRRDNHSCRYCGQMAPDVKLTIDHVVPVALGGSDDPTNLVTACVDCNAGKSSTSPDTASVEDVSQDAMRWADAVRQAAAARSAQNGVRDAYADEFLKAWELWHYGGPYKPQSLPLPTGWRNSLWRFYEAGLPEDEMLRAVEIAGGSRASADATFRYFCGVGWSIVTEIQEAARALLEVQETPPGDA